MGVLTFEGVVEEGRIKLPGNVKLPEQTKVYVIVPGTQVAQPARIASPRLARPEQAADFQLEVIEDSPHAGL